MESKSVSSACSQSAESIRQKMLQTRGALDNDMEEIVESTREMTDWRVYVKRYPWVSVGAAAAVGFALVPKRTEIVSPNADALIELAKRDKLVVKPEPEVQAKSGLWGSAITFVTNAALRGAVAYAGQRFSKLAAVAAAGEHSGSGAGTHLAGD